MPDPIETNALVQSILDEQVQPAINDSLEIKVTAEIKKWQSVMDHLPLQQAVLKRYLNDLKSSIRDLPTELRCKILSLACQGDDDDTNILDPPPKKPHSTPLILSAVSFSFRTLVKAMPTLWTSVSFDVFYRNVYQIIYVLRQYFINSAGRGITIELNFEKQMKLNLAYRNQQTYDGVDVPFIPLHSLIFDEYADRIETLHLRSPPPSWLSLEPTFGEELTNLKNIHISCREIWSLEYPGETRYGRCSIDLRKLPSLEQIWVDYVPSQTHPNGGPLNIRSTPIHWMQNTLTDLRLSDMDYGVCMDLLSLSPNIQNCTMVLPRCDIYPESMVYSSEWTGNILLPHLKTFHWTFPGIHQFYFDLPPALSMPSVQSVTLQNVILIGRPLVDPGLDTFIKNLPHSCKSFSFGCRHNITLEELNDTNRVEAIIQLIPITVTHVKFIAQCVEYLQFFYDRDTLMSRLLKLERFTIQIKQDYTFSFQTGRHIIQPEQCLQGHILKSSDFVAFMFKRRLNINTMTWQVQDLEAQAQATIAKNSKFCFEYKTNCALVEWESVDKRVLKELVREGFGLEIIENGRMVDWL